MDYKKILASIVGGLSYRFFKDIATFILLQVAAYFTADILAKMYDWARINYVLLTFLLMSFAAYLTYFIFYKRNKKQPIFPPIESNIDILERGTIFEIVSDSKIIYKRTYKLKVTQGTVADFTDVWLWTGDGDVTLTCPIKEHNLMQKGKSGIWNVFDISFHRVFKKGEEIITEAVWVVDNIKNLPNPFASVIVQEPTKKLTFKLIFKDSAKVPTEVFCEHTPDISSRLPIDHFSVPPDASKTSFEWSINNPNLLHHYCMRWRWI